MKNISKRIFAILTAVVLIMISQIQVLGAESVMHEMNILLLDDIAEINSCILTETVNMNEIKTVDSSTIQKIKVINGKTEAKCEEIFENLGITFSNESNKQQEVIERFNEISSIVTNTSYIKVSEDGTQTIIDKEVCFSEISTLQNAKRNSINTRSSEMVTDYIDSTDGNSYMKRTLMYIYLGNGYYILGSEWTWLTEPVCRFKDAFSLYSTSFTWENYGTNSYEKVVFFHETITLNGVVVSNENKHENSTADPEIDTNGAFYTWNLPSSSSNATQSIYISDLKCQMWANVRVRYHGFYEQGLDVYSRYVHKKLSITSTYSLSDSDEGVDLNWAIGLGIGYTAYSHYFSWDYAQNRIDYGENA